MEQHRLIRHLFASIACLILTAAPALAVRQLGIDVSSYQGLSINWSSVKNNDGITFAWAKATEGLTVNDSTFTTNEAHAKTAGVYIGAYHFAHPELHLGLSGADQEEDHFWSIAGPYIKGGNAYMMPMLDIESDLTGAGYTKTTLSQWVNRFCSDLKTDAANAGVTITPVVYTYISYASSWLDSTVAQNYPLWMANYNGANPQTGAPNATAPWQSGAWQFWQYNDSGAAGGDSDVLNGDADTLKDYIIGSAGCFNDGSLIKTTAALKAWDSSASNGTYVVEPAGEVGTIIQGPVYGASYQRWQIKYNDGHTGWSAEDFLSTLDAALPGDYDGNARVDDADYLTWRKGQSPNPHSTADYTEWRQHFGQIGGSGAGVGLGGDTNVPEPATLLYLAFAPLLWGGRSRRPNAVRA